MRPIAQDLAHQSGEYPLRASFNKDSRTGRIHRLDLFQSIEYEPEDALGEVSFV